MKKILKIVVLLLLPLFILTACNTNEELKYLVKYDTNGGIPEIILSEEVLPGQKATKPLDPSKEGYEFIHWYSNELNKEFDFDIDVVNQNLVLVAKYQIVSDLVYFELIVPDSVSTNISNKEQVLKNDLVELTVNIPLGQAIESFTVNGLKIQESFYSFNITEDTIVIVTFKDDITNEITYVEDFSVLDSWMKANSYNSSEYLDYEYEGSYGFNYELVNARVDLGMKQGEQGITFSGKGNYLYEYGSGWIMLENFANGISKVEFTGRLPFSKNSTYPQGPGKDSSENVVISVYINDILVQKVKFTNNDKANTGQTFVLDNLSFKGNSSLRIEVSSGHRLTIGSIKITTNFNGPEETSNTIVDFEGTKFKYDTSDAIYTFNNTEFILKEVYTDQMDPDKEQAYMTSINGKVVGRFRGKNTAYIYNNNYFDSVLLVSFDAKQFGANGFFAPDGIIKIYYQLEGSDEFILLEEINTLPETTYQNYTININKENVKVKIEVTGGTLNIDNINYIH